VNYMAIDGGLRTKFHQNCIGDWQAIETGIIASGVPDSNFCINGIEGWIEFKQTSANAVGMRPEQVGWILRRCRAGGRVYIAVRHKHEGGPRKGPPVDRLLLFHGTQAKELKDIGLKTQHIYEGWNWKEVADILTQS
jgi:Holliday junction resolvase